MQTLGIDECAEFLKVDRTTALKLAGNGTLPGAKIGRAWVFLEDDLVDYLRNEARRQARERQSKAIIQEELEASVTRAVATPIAPTRMRKERKVRADLSQYPDELLAPLPAAA